MQRANWWWPEAGGWARWVKGSGRYSRGRAADGTVIVSGDRRQPYLLCARCNVQTGQITCCTPETMQRCVNSTLTQRKDNTINLKNEDQFDSFISPHPHSCPTGLERGVGAAHQLRPLQPQTASPFPASSLRHPHQQQLCARCF